MALGSKTQNVAMTFSENVFMFHKNWQRKLQFSNFFRIEKPSQIQVAEMIRIFKDFPIDFIHPIDENLTKVQLF